MMNLQDGDNFCHFNYDADMILFFKNEEVDSFLALLQNGISIANNYSKNVGSNKT